MECGGSTPNCFLLFRVPHPSRFLRRVGIFRSPLPHKRFNVQFFLYLFASRPFWSLTLDCQLSTRLLTHTSAGCPILRAFCEGWGFSLSSLLLVVVPNPVARFWQAWQRTCLSGCPILSGVAKGGVFHSSLIPNHFSFQFLLSIFRLLASRFHPVSRHTLNPLSSRAATRRGICFCFSLATNH